MKKYWFHDGAGYEGWMSDEEPDAFCSNEQQGPYYLASEVDHLMQRLKAAQDSGIIQSTNKNGILDVLAEIRASFQPSGSHED